ncbi:MAG: metallophosphoesterase [Deferribacterota bacterium]|nr:metallophosphoesterase [Deferribacterota bacterium]
MAVKILHTADLHIRNFNDDRYSTLTHLIDIAKNENVDLFIISGDLFDSGTNAEKLRDKLRQLFNKCSFYTLILPGNHDQKCYREGLYFGDNVIILKDIKPFIYKDIYLWGMPFDTSNNDVIYKLHLLSKKIDPNSTNILIYHGELVDAFFKKDDIGDEEDRRYMPVRLSYFNNLNINYVLAGHFHTKFDIHRLNNGGYFVYPGSPISITKKEIGIRKVNLFNVNEPPREYPVDTPYYEELQIELDPFDENSPINIIKERLSKVGKNAKIILKVKGYINSSKIKIREDQLVKEINELPNNIVEKELEFKDISRILEHSLFYSFQEKLKQKDYSENYKKELTKLAIKAMMEISL